SMRRWQKPSFRVLYETQIMVSGTAFTATPQDHLDNVFFGHACRIQLSGGLGQFHFPPLLFEPLQFLSQAQKLIRIELGSSVDNLLNGHTHLPFLSSCSLGSIHSQVTIHFQLAYHLTSICATNNSRLYNHDRHRRSRRPPCKRCPHPGKK